jgi:hypothetical protein
VQGAGLFDFGIAVAGDQCSRHFLSFLMAFYGMQAKLSNGHLPL